MVSRRFDGGGISKQRIKRKNEKTKSDESFFISSQLKNKYCFQYKLPSGLQKDSSKVATVWLGNISNGKEKSDGILCEKINVKNEDTKENCLKNISEKAAEIGNNTPINTNWETSESGACIYNDVNSTKMNPFQVPIQSVFPVTQDEDYTIILYYHFGPFNHGYIVQIYDNGSNGIMSYEQMLSEGEYRNIHNTTQNDTILNQTNDKNDNIKFDSYTKLAGEGARFQCVRNHIKKIRNNSKFFTFKTKQNQNNRRQIKYVYFHTLWSSWGDKYNHKFNIPNNEVINKLSDNGDISNIEIDYDFNLDECRAAAEEDKFVTKIISVDSSNDDLQIFQDQVNKKKISGISSFMPSFNKQSSNEQSFYDVLCQENLEEGEIITMINNTIEIHKPFHSSDKNMNFKIKEHSPFYITPKLKEMPYSGSLENIVVTHNFKNFAILSTETFGDNIIIPEQSVWPPSTLLIPKEGMDIAYCRVSIEPIEPKEKSDLSNLFIKDWPIPMNIQAYIKSPVPADL